MSPARAKLCVDMFTALVIASVGVSLASLTWRLQGHPGIGPAAAPVAPGAGPDTDIRPILALAPFGAAAASPGAGDDGSATLRAIFMAVPAESSTALIAGADGKVAAYGLGQAIGGGVIESIESDRVVLRVAGGQRVIGFNPAAAAALAAGANPSVHAEAAAASFVAAPASAPPATGAAAIRALIPAGVQGQPPPGAVGVQPATTGAPAVAGYRVGSAPNPALLAAGLRPGDVVVKVNGTSVNAGTNERDLMAGAMASGTARVELLRDGQRVSLTVPVR